METSDWKWKPTNRKWVPTDGARKQPTRNRIWMRWELESIKEKWKIAEGKYCMTNWQEVWTRLKGLDWWRTEWWQSSDLKIHYSFESGQLVGQLEKILPNSIHGVLQRIFIQGVMDPKIWIVDPSWPLAKPGCLLWLLRYHRSWLKHSYDCSRCLFYSFSLFYTLIQLHAAVFQFSVTQLVESCFWTPVNEYVAVRRPEARKLLWISFFSDAANNVEKELCWSCSSYSLCRKLSLGNSVLMYTGNCRGDERFQTESTWTKCLASEMAVQKFSCESCPLIRARWLSG